MAEFLKWIAILNIWKIRCQVLFILIDAKQAEKLANKKCDTLNSKIVITVTPCMIVIKVTPCMIVITVTPCMIVITGTPCMIVMVSSVYLIVLCVLVDIYDYYLVCVCELLLLSSRVILITTFPSTALTLHWPDFLVIQSYRPSYHSY